MRSQAQGKNGVSDKVGGKRFGIQVIDWKFSSVQVGNPCRSAYSQLISVW